MPVCPTCQTQLEANARFCPKDGTTIVSDSLLLPLATSAGTSTAGTSAGGAGAGAAEETPTGFKPTVPTPTVRRKKRASTATTDPSADPLIGKLLDGRYRIRARLGQGGVGAVYQGEHVEMKKTVAIKVLHPLYASTDEFRKRFEREARAASRLSHPAIVQVTDFGRVEKVDPAEPKLLGIPYLVMEFVRGQVLLDRLMDGPVIAPPEAVAIGRDILGALKHAHTLGIVHRDIKPANIMLVASTPGDETASRVKLLDFGLAKELLAEGEPGEAPLTQAGMVFGTPGYLSPEQAAGRPIDARSDLYSVGVVLFEMACNRRLFDRADPLDAVRDHLHTPPPDPRTLNAAISAPLSRTILKSLEKDRDKRFADAESFAAALAACPEAGAGAETPVWRGRALGRPMWQWAAIGAGACALLVSSALLLGKAAPPHLAPPQPTALGVVAPRVTAIAPAALRHLELAASYQRKLWCSDTIDELERALREDLRLQSDSEVAHLAIACLAGRSSSKASRFLVERLGADARDELEATATSEPNPDVRRNAQKVLSLLPR